MVPRRTIPLDVANSMNVPVCNELIHLDSFRIFRKAGRFGMRNLREIGTNGDQRACGPMQLQALDEGEGFGELREARFLSLEFSGVNAAAQATRFDRIFEVQHLVVEEILDCVSRA
ncbi:hypothetical protein SBA5_130037 [Candidatus Sulfotelmatomonas gaucii]|uniref:Uncharacterized protein n=1 Tax=Candidatus Sulfuritelmatomonas gaucii TaxID=2043161 RepID=A0A2N9L484_9BACT|nr:hypothetical protein SBA5_130037 [Candidatus Sulfotelmatomonas gaucii]